MPLVGSTFVTGGTRSRVSSQNVRHRKHIYSLQSRYPNNKPCGLMNEDILPLLLFFFWHLSAWNASWGRKKARSAGVKINRGVHFTAPKVDYDVFKRGQLSGTQTLFITDPTFG